MTTQEFVSILVAAGFLVIVACIVFVTFYLIKVLKSIANLADSVHNTTQGIKENLQLKLLAAIPALLVAIVGKILKRGR